MGSFGIPYIDDRRQDITGMPMPLVAQPPQLASMMPQDAGPAPGVPDIPRIGDHTPLGRFAQPILPAPQVSVAPTPIEGQIGHTQQELKKLQDQDANPYGSANNHPGLGGKILHGLSVAGNIAGNFLDPNLMALTPGTQLNRSTRERSLLSRLADLDQVNTEDKSRAATTAETELRTKQMPQKADDEHGLNDAQTRHINDEANTLENPVPEYEVHDTQEGPLFVNKRTGAAQRLSVDGHPVGPKIQTKTVQLQIGGKPHQVLVNDTDGTPIKDLGESGEKPANVSVNTGTWSLQEGADGKPVEFNAKTGETRSAPEGLQKSGTFSHQQAAGIKTFQPALDSAERFNIMSQNYEDAIKNHDQQAMLSLLSNHLGMTAGLQKGGRITKDMYTEAQQSRPWLQGAKASFGSDGYLSGVTLAPEQMRQMVRLGRDRFQQDVSKSKNEAAYQGVQGEGPSRTPTPATVRFYLNLAGGDQTKAMKLAAEDGWSAK